MTARLYPQDGFQPWARRPACQLVSTVLPSADPQLSPRQRGDDVTEAPSRRARRFEDKPPVGPRTAFATAPAIGRRQLPPLKKRNCGESSHATGGNAARGGSANEGPYRSGRAERDPYWGTTYCGSFPFRPPPGKQGSGASAFRLARGCRKINPPTSTTPRWMAGSKGRKQLRIEWSSKYSEETGKRKERLGVESRRKTTGRTIKWEGQPNGETA